MIVRTPGTCDGSARIAGTSVAVWQIVQLRRAGRSAGEIVAELGGLWPSNVDEAMAYADAHPEEIDAAISASEAA